MVVTGMHTYIPSTQEAEAGIITWFHISKKKKDEKRKGKNKVAWHLLKDGGGELVPSLYWAPQSLVQNFSSHTSELNY